MVLRRLGFSVLLLERGRHPRFAIGESSTPFANLLLERIALEFDLPFLRSLAEWGPWQRDFPQLGCGLKRGFSFFAHRPGEPLDLDDRETQLLVAASPNDRVADTHWYRPDFDHFLVQKAQEMGVAYRDQVRLERCRHEAVWRINGAGFSAAARFAIDASGPAGVLARELGIFQEPVRQMPPTRAVFAHFRNVGPLGPFPSGAPYPPEDAAVHHLLEEGWIWVLRFNNGMSSAGAALRAPRVEAPPDEIWRGLLRRYPALKEQFASAELATPFFDAPTLSYRRSAAAAETWALLPATAGFIDPLLSTGFALNLHGILRLGRMFQRGGFNPSGYEAATFLEFDAAAELIGALYRKMNSFQEFAALSLIYFAALSYTEKAWREGQPERASQFLLANDPEFTAVRRRFSAEGATVELAEIARAIAPWDVAGLGDLSRRNHYPAL
jgi:FADH2 O2-dependent halogenase